LTIGASAIDSGVTEACISMEILRAPVKPAKCCK
jgi:hypothetical protein